MLQCCGIVWFRHGSDCFNLPGVWFQSLRGELVSHEWYVCLSALDFLFVQFQVPFSAFCEKRSFILFEAIVHLFSGVSKPSDNKVISNDLYNLEPLHKWCMVLCHTCGVELMPKGIQSQQYRLKGVFNVVL